jgi:hypothetical protein
VKYWPRQFDEMAEDPVPVSFLIEPLPADNVGVMVPAQARPLHAIVAQSLADVEGLIARLETTGVRVADSGRGLIRDLYVQCSEAA